LIDPLGDEFRVLKSLGRWAVRQMSLKIGIQLGARIPKQLDVECVARL